MNSASVRDLPEQPVQQCRGVPSGAECHGDAQVSVGVHVAHQPRPVAREGDGATRPMGIGRTRAERGVQRPPHGRQERRPGALGVGDERARNARRRLEGRRELLGPRPRQVGGEGRHRSGHAARPVLERRIEPGVRLVGDGPRAQAAHQVGRCRVVGATTIADHRTREGRGDGVGQQGEHERVVGARRIAEGLGERPQASLRDGEALRRDDDRPAGHAPM